MWKNTTPKCCVSLGGKALEEQVLAAKAWGADLAELRVDLLEQNLLTLPKTLPLILTYRSKDSLEKRQERLIELAHLAPAYLDLESDLPLSFFKEMKARFPKLKIIASCHLDSLEHLEREEKQLQELPADHYKLVYPTPTWGIWKDIERVQDKWGERPLTLIHSHYKGQASRLLFPWALPHAWIYSYLNKPTAAGQFSLEELAPLKKAPQKLYGLLGNPTSQSRGAQFHNPRLNALGAAYLKFDLEESELAPWLEGAPRFGFSGLSITMPFKEKVLACCSPSSLLSANTLKLEEGKWQAYNTDGPAVCDLIEERFSLKGKTALILGYGGLGKFLAAELVRRGATVSVSTRKEQNTPYLKVAWGQLPAHDILLQTTPIGMKGERLNGSLLPFSLVVECVQERTPLEQAAQKQQIPCITGRDLFERQARYQQEIWL